MLLPKSFSKSCSFSTFLSTILDSRIPSCFQIPKISDHIAVLSINTKNDKDGRWRQIANHVIDDITWVWGAFHMAPLQKKIIYNTNFKRERL